MDRKKSKKGGRAHNKNYSQLYFAMGGDKLEQ
jgi:hypothetical protein